MNMFKAGMKMAAIIVLVGGLVFHGSPALAEIAPEKVQDIRKLLKLSGIEEQLGYMKDGLLNTYGSMINSAYPKVPDAFWTEYYTLIGDNEMESLIEKIIPVYDKHMSHEVVRKLIAMFENPFWNEWKTKMPLISREAGLIGSHWGQELMQSETFTKKVEQLVAAHQLEKLNSEPEQTKPQQ